MSKNTTKIFGKPICCTTILLLLLFFVFRNFGNFEIYIIITSVLIALLWIDAIIGLSKKYFGVGMVECPSCGEKVDAKSKFCEKCGFAFLKSCPICHITLKGAPEKCPECGYDLVN